MALRSRPRSPNATSGPGRGPGSDGRSRRPRPPGGARTGHRHASAEENRRRAKVLFAQRPREQGEMGMGPPGPLKTQGAPQAEVSDGEGEQNNADAGADAHAHVHVDAGGGGGGGGDIGIDGDEVRKGSGSRVAGPWQERVGLALRERMPVWLLARCGLERRSVLALSVLLVVAAAFAVQHFWVGRAQPVRAPEVVRAAAAPYEAGEPNPAAGPVPSAGSPGAGSTAGAEIVVDVSGKVRKPGIHRLPAGSRVVDALGAAGGVRPGTDTDGLNRARFLVDGEQVVVGGPVPPAGAAGTGPGSAAGSTGTGMGAGPPAPVSLNTATVDQFDTLPGVGPVLAQHIIDYRAQHGGFRSVDELREVNGIGERRFADLRNLVRP
ncbi:ComEA family DNA-binding protein [Streptomyces sp. NPDC002755]|uniref:ComEA family DNA-binding protein n=1 Tax=Streptomyces sp. NPDC002884 TaxID=3154544 RepID=UPI003331BCFD